MNTNFINKVYPDRMYKLFERNHGSFESNTGFLELYSGKFTGFSKTDLSILRDSQICNVYKRRNSAETVLPRLLNNVSFKRKVLPTTGPGQPHCKDRGGDGMITSIDSFKNVITVTNSRGLISVYSVSEMLCYRDLNNGKGPMKRYPLGYVLTESERLSLEKGMKFKVRPISEIEPGENSNHRGVISSVSLSQLDGELFITSGWDNKLKVWDTIESQCVYTLDCGFRVNYSSICMENGNIVGSGLNDGTVKILDLRVGRIVQELNIDSKITNLKGDNFKSPILSLSWREDSEHILSTATKSGFIRLWDLRFAPQPYLYMNNNHVDWAYVQETSYVSPILLKGCTKEEFSCYTGRNAEGRNKISRSTNESLNSHEELFLKTGKILRSKASGSGSSGETELIEDRHSTAGKNCDPSYGINAPCKVGYAHESGINYCSFINNGRNIVSSSFDGTIKLWNALNGKNCYVPFDKYDSQTLWEEEISGLNETNSYSSGGTDDRFHYYFKRFAVCGAGQDILYHPCGNEIGIWNIKTGKCMKRISAHINAKSVNIVHSDKISNLVISGDQSGGLLLWRTQQGKF